MIASSETELLDQGLLCFRSLRPAHARGLAELRRTLGVDPDRGPAGLDRYLIPPSSLPHVRWWTIPTPAGPAAILTLGGATEKLPWERQARALAGQKQGLWSSWSEEALAVIALGRQASGLSALHQALAAGRIALLERAFGDVIPGQAGRGLLLLIVSTVGAEVAAKIQAEVREQDAMQGRLWPTALWRQGHLRRDSSREAELALVLRWSAGGPPIPGDALLRAEWREAAAPLATDFPLAFRILAGSVAGRTEGWLTLAEIEAAVAAATREHDELKQAVDRLKLRKRTGGAVREVFDLAGRYGISLRPAQPRPGAPAEIKLSVDWAARHARRSDLSAGAGLLTQYPVVFRIRAGALDGRTNQWVSVEDIVLALTGAPDRPLPPRIRR